MSWVFGFSKDLLGGIVDLTTPDSQCFLYCAANTAVIFDYELHQQRLLQGHTNPITAVCVSNDKKLVVTADSGEHCMISVWDAATGTPIATIFEPHLHGVLAVDISADCSTIVSLSSGEGSQEIALWNWSHSCSEPTVRTRIHTQDVQTWVKFHPEDMSQLLSNGLQRVIFWQLADDGASLKYYSPPLSSRDFKCTVSSFSCSVFIPNTHSAISGTVDGDIIVWDVSLLPQPGARATDRHAVKKVRLFAPGVQVAQLQVLGPFVVAGTSDGAVRFYDHKLRILAWYEDLELGPITSVALTAFAQSDMPVPNFIVGTSSGNIAMVNATIFEKIAAEERKGELLIEGFSHPILSVATHRELQICAVMQSNAVVSLIDLDDRSVRTRVSFSGSIVPSLLEYDVRGRYLIIGGCDSQLFVCSAASMQVEQRCRVGKEKHEDRAVRVLKIAFAPDGSHFAVACDDHSVSIFRFERNMNDDGKEVNWLHLGRAIAHRAPIVGLQFAEDITKPSGQSLRLFSVGSDRLLTEYDLSNSTVVGGVKIFFVAPVEETARPTSFVVLPQFLQRKSKSRGIVIIVSNNEYKFKVIDPDKLSGVHTDVSRLSDSTSACLNTFLGPVSAGPPCSLSLLPCGQADMSFLAYACPNKVAGLLWLPIDGNPHRGSGVIAHPGEIVAACASADGKLLVTSGGTDVCVCLWGIDTAAAAAAAALGGTGMDSVWAAIDGGKDGEFAEEIRDFFVYAQIRRQGEDTRDERLCVGWVRPDDVPDLFCALGSYPSQFEVFSKFCLSLPSLTTLLLGARVINRDGR